LEKITIEIQVKMKRKSIVLSQMNNAKQSTEIKIFCRFASRVFSGSASERIEEKKVPTLHRSGPFIYPIRVRLIPEGCSPAEPFPFHLTETKIIIEKKEKS
jgi:hypothetical protein